MKLLLVAVLAITVTGCSIQPEYPNRAITQEVVNQLETADIVLHENNAGVAVSWRMQDRGLVPSLLGGYVGGGAMLVIDLVANAGSASRAKRKAGEINAVVNLDMINESMYDSLQQLQGSGTALRVSQIRMSQPIGSEPIVNSIGLDLTYVLSESLNAMRVIADVEMFSDHISYVIPVESNLVDKRDESDEDFGSDYFDEYDDHGEFDAYWEDRSAKSGPVYKSRYVYESDKLQSPLLTDQMKEELVTLIIDYFSHPSGQLPIVGSDERTTMDAELAQARDDVLSKSEVAKFLMRSWIHNDGELVMTTIKEAHDFFAEQIARDLSLPDMSGLTRQDQVLETDDHGRAVVYRTSGEDAGTIFSLPGNVSEFSSYGNFWAISKVNSDRMRELKRVSKREKK